MKSKILLMGPQGSGKGTQAELLSKRLNIPCFAMGQLLRDEVASGSETGQEIDSLLRQGILVSDKTAAEVLQRRLSKPDTENGYILDGYPRNSQQYEAFNFDVPTHVIVIELDREESLKRLGGRLTCSGCGKIYSEKDGHAPGNKCECGGEMVRRADDTPEAIMNRLEIYRRDTEPVIEKYAADDLVHKIDGKGSVEEVQDRIVSILGL